MTSRTAAIDFSFSQANTVRGLLKALAEGGWSEQEPMGVSYVVNSDGLFDWQWATRDRGDEVVALLDSSQADAYDVGLCVYHALAETGGQLLLSPGRTECSFAPTINRRSIDDAFHFTDMSWYLGALVPRLIPLGLTGYEVCDRTPSWYDTTAPAALSPSADPADPRSA
ncbi:hypothetical protein [Streptomyces sp. NPDC052225]|uniref:hypothetical protein n=1 Tax=Streptomyces sp. NPDC052225 TaxID=3154949 RepID=UPI00343BFB9B